MPIEYHIRKLRFYLSWYEKLDQKAREGWLGAWVMERIIIFSNIITDFEKGVARFKGNQEGPAELN